MSEDCLKLLLPQTNILKLIIPARFLMAPSSTFTFYVGALIFAVMSHEILFN